MTLQWTDVSNYETGYSIQQLVGSEWQEVGWTDPNTISATIEGTFEPLTEYSFRVQARSDWSVSLFSNELTQTMPAWPTASTDLVRHGGLGHRDRLVLDWFRQCDWLHHFVASRGFNDLECCWYYYPNHLSGDRVDTGRDILRIRGDRYECGGQFSNCLP